ncbi:reticulocyte-binding protein homolog 2a isoform X2 [Mugil cephalus]|nr:reticulocyte-binding protein homolog 2a isoform X2 [Mugil cephalus]
MGLQHKMTHSQASKKWENMKKRYKELKFPPEGVKVSPETWSYFSLMEDAMAGRLEGTAPILKVLPSYDKGDFLSISKPKKRKVFPAAAFVVDGPEVEISLNGAETFEEAAAQEGKREEECISTEVELNDVRSGMDCERYVMEREKEVMKREQLVLQRERAVLDREMALLDRDRALLERERATLEREKALMEKERVMVEKDKDAVCRDRLDLEREKIRLERLFYQKERTEEGKDADVMDRKERFLHLFERLIEHF